MSLRPCQRVQPEDIQDSFMLVLVVKFSILRRSKTTHVGNKGSSLDIPRGRYTKVWADPRNGDSGMRGMLPRLPWSCRCSPAQSDPSSFLNFELVFAPAAKLRTISYGTALYSCPAAHLARHPCSAARLCAVMQTRAWVWILLQGPSAVRL